MKHHRATRPVAIALAVTMAVAQTAGADTAISIGDGKVASSPRRGYVMSCQTRFNPNA